jgi:hypothetical protein
VKKKKSNVPVFLIYAGIIHAIGLALLLPMLITLPGPGGAIAPKAASIDVEIVPAAAEQTSALAPAQAPAEESPVEAVGSEPGAEPAAEVPREIANIDPEAGAEPAVEAPREIANIDPEAQPEDAQDSAAGQEQHAAATPPPDERKNAASGSAKKPVAQRSKTARPAIHRSTRTQSKIFNGALSGLFSPGAPATKRR